MRDEKIIPDYTKEFFEFLEKFDTPIGFHEPTGLLVIGEYEIPDDVDITKKRLEELIKKSVKENYNYLADFAKEKGKIINYRDDYRY